MLQNFPDLRFTDLGCALEVAGAPLAGGVGTKFVDIPLFTGVHIPSKDGFPAKASAKGDSAAETRKRTSFVHVCAFLSR